ncbi:Hpt domain-containing protein [Amantichitinum ursilacus]|uniref:Hpt domain protein n=1 Tax=Amantichitinum ursilacus TaxID=857265 RepID=A0A0N0GQU7_9NEIS|nr:Hpt domain-containing protein [Amantichitinum ursilacus]KPC54781.1 Hpt domain protein [Amantichitinum ursilacus]
MSSDYQRAVALAALADDQALLVELIGVFLADVPMRVATLQAAAEAGDLATVAHQAHALKGECGTLAATVTVGHLRALEMAARAGDTRAVAEAWTDAIGSVHALLNDLKAEYDTLA